MKLTTLFLDMNSFFASVEQQRWPECRGRPVAVAAVDADTTCCIAASYEAKRFGVRTGMLVGQAKAMCPGLRVLIADPPVYTDYHEKILRAVDTCIPIHAVLSIDEMACKLSPHERREDRAVELARSVKDAIANQVGRHLKCSIGLAPNVFLAKIAADMQKPDGLTVIRDRDLPHKLYTLQLDDLAGIGPRMLRRLQGRGIFTVQRLCQLSEEQLRDMWGGVVGARWWYWLRGHELPEARQRRSSISHSHVLPPGLRTDQGSTAVLVRLIHKCMAKLRLLGYWARRMQVYVSFTWREEGWSGEVPLGWCQDTPTAVQAFHALWRWRPQHCGAPTQVAITLFDLTADAYAPQPLFAEEVRRNDLSKAMDAINLRFGAGSIYLGGMHEARNEAPTRIAFNSIPNFDFRCS